MAGLLVASFPHTDEYANRPSDAIVRAPPPLFDSSSSLVSRSPDSVEGSVAANDHRRRPPEHPSADRGSRGGLETPRAIAPPLVMPTRADDRQFMRRTSRIPTPRRSRRDVVGRSQRPASLHLRRDGRRAGGRGSARPPTSSKSSGTCSATSRVHLLCGYASGHFGDRRPRSAGEICDATASARRKRSARGILLDQRDDESASAASRS